MTDRPDASAAKANMDSLTAGARMMDEVIVLDALMKEPPGINTIPFHGNAVILEQPISNLQGAQIADATLNGAAPYAKMSAAELKAELAAGNAKLDKGYEAVAGFRFKGEQFCVADCRFGKLILDGTVLSGKSENVHQEIPVAFELPPRRP